MYMYWKVHTQNFRDSWAKTFGDCWPRKPLPTVMSEVMIVAKVLARIQLLFYSCLFAFPFWWGFLFVSVIHIFTFVNCFIIKHRYIGIRKNSWNSMLIIGRIWKKVVKQKASFPIHFAGVLWLPLWSKWSLKKKKSENEKNIYIISFQIRHFKSIEISRQNFPKIIFWVIYHRLRIWRNLLNINHRNVLNGNQNSRR